MNIRPPLLLKVVQIMLYVEAGLIAVAAVMAALALGAVGLLSNADNGGQQLGMVGAIMLAWLVICAAIVTAFIILITKLYAWRWACWALLACQVLLLVMTVEARPTFSAYTALQIAYPLLVIAGLLAPSSQRALGIRKLASSKK